MLDKKGMTTMNITLKNIGKVQNARVNITGITVIAGENDTGKSTISKSLFAIFHGFHNLEKRMNYDLKESVLKVFRTYLGQQISYNLLNSYSQKFLETFSNGGMTDEVKEWLSKHNAELFSPDVLKDVVPRICEYINISKDLLRKGVLTKIFRDEFHRQINSLQSPDEGYISLSIKQKQLSVSLKNNEIIDFIDNVPLKTDVIYLDNPFVLDELNNFSWSPLSMEYISSYEMNHERWAIWCLLSKRSISAEEIIVRNRLQHIYEKLNDVCQGDLKTFPTTEEWAYQKNDKAFLLRNLSTGLKTFVILKALLENGSLTQRGTLILDEPEIHLHPSWQLIFAEIIVLLHKEFDLHILINTHSPYFFRAIEVYVKKYEVQDKCDFYLSTSNGDIAEFENVNENTEKIYKKLWQPFQRLENEEQD